MISAESEKGWCGGDSVPSASGCAREGRSPLDFQSKGFPQEIVSASHRGWQWRGSKLPRHIVYPLIPCIDIPSTSCFWKKKNRISTGTIDSADIANVAP